MNFASVSAPASDTLPSVDLYLRSQSLAEGAAGVALLQVERARRGCGSWSEAHAVLAACADNLVADDRASLYFGAPAVAFAMHTAAAGTARYERALKVLDAQTAQITRRRLAQAHARIDDRERPRPAEYDLFYGLTGLGCYLLCRNPSSPVLREVLTYLVRLIEPLDGDKDQLPGWWTSVGPDGTLSADYPGGHGNNGMAHGAAGILSLLALAARAGVIVSDQTAAIFRVCLWLDLQRQDTSTGSWWPGWLTRAEYRARAVKQTGPPRPGWCYGTPGLARAQQLAGIALGDAHRKRMAEQALLACLADPAQLSLIGDVGICHGAAGLLHTTSCVGRDAEVDGFSIHLPRLRVLLLKQVTASQDGFLNGAAGSALALMAADANGMTASGWDACLLSG